jgi:hypothetical protein
MTMYNKIFTKILDSSVWLEPSPTRIVWITFIAAMDENGFCPFAAVGNVASRAHVSIDEAREAIKVLESPDADSSDPENEGRRIEKVPGGWMVLNAPKYRAIVTRANHQEKTRERVRRFRQKRSGNASVTQANDPVTPSEAYTEADAEAETKTTTDKVDPQDVAERLKLELQINLGYGPNSLRDAVIAVAEVAQKSGQDLEDFSALLIASCSLYRKERKNLRTPWGWAKFIGEGYWRDPASWPWRENYDAECGEHSEEYASLIERIAGPHQESVADGRGLSPGEGWFQRAAGLR